VESGSLKAGFQQHKKLCRGTNHEILSKGEEIGCIWENCSQDLLTPPATADQSKPQETTYTNQADTEEELEEEPPDILDT